MSRLDSAIRRLSAQRACLDWACAAIADKPGCVLELGLGNGRTYDHLRARLAERDIFVFDRALACHPDSRPPAENYFEGEITATLKRFAARRPPAAVLAHLDLGAGDSQETRRNLAGVCDALMAALAPGAVILSDQPLQTDGGFAAMPLPEGIPPGRYHIYGFTPKC